MPLSGTDNLLWAAGLVGHLLLLGVLLGKGRARQFPFFTALILNSVLRTLLLKALVSNEEAYLLVYLVTNVMDCLLQLAVTYEIATHTFKPLGHWAKDTRKAILLLVGVSLAIGLGLTLLASPDRPTLLGDLVIKVNFFSSALQVELFLGMLALAATVGLPWKTHVARIAYGLGAYSLVGVLVGTGFTMYDKIEGMPGRGALIHTRQLLYLVCVGYWIVTLWQDAPQPRELPPQLRERLSVLNARVAYDLSKLRSGSRLDL